MQGRGRGRSLCTVLAATAGLLLVGCGPFEGLPERSPTSDPAAPVQDLATGRWFSPEAVTEESTGMQERLPQVEVTSGIALEGQFTDPHDRVPIPAQDDYWWQAVVVVGQEQVAQLIGEAHAAAASDGGGEEEPLTGPDADTANAPAGTRAEDSVVQGRVMGPLEEAAGTCPTDWILLHSTFTADESDTIRPVTADGLVIVMAAVCEGGDRIVVDARES